MNGWMVASWLVTGPIIYDLLNRPESQWIASDRRKGVWVVFALFCLWLYPLVLALLAGYLLWLLPVFNGVGAATSPRRASAAKFGRHT